MIEMVRGISSFCLIIKVWLDVLMLNFVMFIFFLIFVIFNFDLIGVISYYLKKLLFLILSCFLKFFVSFVFNVVKIVCVIFV